MKNKIQEFKKRFINAQSDLELAEIDNEIDILAQNNQNAFENAMLSSIRETNKRMSHKVLQKVKPAIQKRLRRAVAVI
jgi:hypothetical protein